MARRPDRTAADAALAAHILQALVQAGKPTTVHQVRGRWERERPDDGPGAVTRDIERALARLHEAHVVVWHGTTNRIRIGNELMLRLAADQHQSGG